MPIAQVKRGDLVSWLQSKAAEGFAIVGIEQTAGTTHAVAILSMALPI
jgi:hypothetical protein